MSATTRAFVCIVLLLGSAVARADLVRLSSGAGRTSLVELFTSEGCSSCPPAEQWLSALRSDSKLWRDFVPIAFHVDYWNRLGWPDRFSTRANTQREYAYAATWHSPSVYTPCFVRDGVEWRGARHLGTAGAKVGILTATYDGSVLHAEFQPADKSDPATVEVHAAILGGGITSKVTAGENRGATLRHEFVALALTQGNPGDAIPLPRIHREEVSRYAIAVWITRRGELTPLQATGGWLD